MTIKKSVEHFEWKIVEKLTDGKVKLRKNWKPTMSDVKALNSIVEFVEDKHKKQIQDYHLFAKLYIMVYAQYLERYKTTIFDDIPRKELHKLLDNPIEVFMQRFTDRLNESELYSLFDELNIKMDHPVLKSEIEKEKETDILEKAIKDDDNFKRFTGQMFDLETVTENLELQINNVINEFR